jgi:hypothetical protein
MPTFTHGKEAVFKVADSGATLRDISTVLNSVSLSREADTAEVSALGTDDKAYIAGLRDATISIEGMADVPATLTAFSGLSRRLSSTRLARVPVRSSTPGRAS